jgi:uncharacterized protein YuzE
MHDFPSKLQDGSGICVTVEPNPISATRKTCEFVLDLDATGIVIGIEIINLKLHAGPNALGAVQRRLQSPSGSMKYNYDDESDCFYLQIAMGPSVDQRAVDGIVTLNQKGEIVGFSADAIT